MIINGKKYTLPPNSPDRLERLVSITPARENELRRVVVEDEFDEDLHPRDEKGQFTSGGGDGSSGGSSGGSTGTVSKDNLAKFSERLRNIDTSTPDGKLERHVTESMLYELGWSPKDGHGEKDWTPNEEHKAQCYGDTHKMRELSENLPWVSVSIPSGGAINGAKRDLAKHADIRERALQSLGLQADYENWKSNR